MSITVTSLARYYVPVTPTAVVHPVRPKVEQERSRLAPLAGVAPPSVSSTDDLRQARADAIAELQGAPDDEDADTRRYLGLDRDQLAAMVFDRTETYSLPERRSAKRQLDSNDSVYLDRATELSQISGDDRVLLNARIELEQSKSRIERAVPASEAVDTAALQAQVAARTADLGGEPSSISLRYPTGWAAAGNDRTMSESPQFSNVSPGATRIAELYRDSLF